MAGKVPDQNFVQVPFRMHRNDHYILKKLLLDKDLTLQLFMTACVESFLRGDPQSVKAIEDWMQINALPKDMRDKYTLSHRERQDILDEIEEEEYEQKLDKDAEENAKD